MRVQNFVTESGHLRSALVEMIVRLGTLTVQLLYDRENQLLLLLLSISLTQTLVLAFKAVGLCGSRAWTYQEAVNGRRLSFVTEGEGSEMVSGHDFLNAVMIAIDKYKSQNGLDDEAWERRPERLRSLERLLADYRISDYASRSAYQVMSVMDERLAERPEDHFYAMVGSIAESARVDGDENLTPSEYFMRVCERKADFSFIYNAAPRDETVGQRWRPLDGRFPTVLPKLITFGSSERGTAHATHLSLENMYRLQPGTIGSAGLKSVRWFARASESCTSSEDLALRTLERLRTLGFSGTGEYLEFETGFFFPQSESELSREVFAVVSSDIHWVTGGPDLLLRTASSGIHEFYDVGAFVGKSPKSGEKINLNWFFPHGRLSGGKPQVQ